MAAALGGMVSRPEAETPELDEQQTETQNVVRAVAPIAPEQTFAPRDVERESEYRRTGTGYVKTDGTELVRTVVMMTESERRRLKIEAVREGLSASDYVRRALGFLPEE